MTNYAAQDFLSLIDRDWQKFNVWKHSLCLKGQMNQSFEFFVVQSNVLIKG